MQRPGHAGTLDPFATGLLIVLIGRATKAQRQMMELRKRYETVAQLGAVSSTGDTEGEITETGRMPSDPPPLPTGELRQRPPRYSAVKIGGERAYKRARRGEQFELPERIVSVYRFEQLWRADADPLNPGTARHSPPGCVPAGSGWILDRMLGRHLCSFADRRSERRLLPASCRRTAIGPFEVEDAVAPPRRGERHGSIRR